MIEIKKFDGTNSRYYMIQFENYLYGKKFHLSLLEKKSDNTRDADWNLLDRKVLGVIQLTLSRLVAHNIIKKKNSVDPMAASFDMYEKPSTNNNVHFMKKLFKLKMVEDTYITQHLNFFNTITNQLSFVEIEFDDEVQIQALILFVLLPNIWEIIKMIVSNYARMYQLGGHENGCE